MATTAGASRAVTRLIAATATAVTAGALLTVGAVPATATAASITPESAAAAATAPSHAITGRRIPFRFLEFLCETPRRQIPVLRSTASDPGATKLVQYSLRFLDYPVGPVDGSYGPVTRAAVRQYQRDFGLVIDGVTGPQTWGSLQRTIC